MHTVVDAINALEVVVKGNEARVNQAELYYTPNVAVEDRYSLVGAALLNSGATLLDLVAMGPLKIEYLYERGHAPLGMTLGAALVYRAAQRTQDGLAGDDRSWGAAFDNAVKAAGRLIDLIPDSAVAAARAELVTA